MLFIKHCAKEANNMHSPLPIVDTTESAYYAKGRWYTYDFEANPPQKIPNLKVKTKQKMA